MASFFERVRPVALRLVVPVVAVFLCTLTVVIRPIARLSPEYAFLVLTMETLFFFPGSTIGGQVEMTIIGLLGNFIGLAYGSVVISLCTVMNKRHDGGEAPGSRVLGAFAIALAAIVVGYVKSASPRLTTGSRLALFHSIWIIPKEYNRTNLPAVIVLQLLYPTLFAAFASLAARFLVPTTSTSIFVSLSKEVFHTSEQLLKVSVDNFFHPTPQTSADVQKLRLSVMNQSAALPRAYAQTTYEVSYSTFNPHRLRPFIAAERKLRRTLANSAATTLDGKGAILSRMQPAESPFEAPMQRFVSTLSRAFHAIHLTLDGQPDGRIVEAREAMKESLQQFQAEMDLELERALIKGGDQVVGGKLDRSLLHVSLAVYKLIEVAATLDEALAAALILHIHTSHKRRLRLPRLTAGWLGDASVSAAWDVTALKGEDEDPDGDTPDRSEREIGIELSIAEAYLTPSIYKQNERQTVLDRVVNLPRRAWDSRLILQGRFRMAKTIISLKKRRLHLLHAFKVGLGVTLLTLPAFMPASNSARNWWLNQRGSWIPISFLYVLETTTGQTWRVGLFRAIGTVFGSIIGVLIWLICQNNPYGLVVMTTIYGAITASIMIYSSFPGVGLVASITIPAIVYVPYQGLPYRTVIEIAWERTSDVLIGIAAAILVTQIVFPAPARILFLKSTASILDDLAKIYLVLSRDTLSLGPYQRTQTETLERALEDNMVRSKGYLTTLRLEVTLLHKPLKIYQNLLETAQKIQDLLLSIALIREKIPRQHTVFGMLEQRKDIMSSIQICLFTCSSAWRSQMPLPEYLPSPLKSVATWQSVALERLSVSGTVNLDASSSVDDVSGLAPGSTREALLKRDTAFLYAFAEAEALQEVASLVQQLIDLSRALFGSANFSPSSACASRSGTDPTSTPTPPHVSGTLLIWPQGRGEFKRRRSGRDTELSELPESTVVPTEAEEDEGMEQRSRTILA